MHLINVRNVHEALPEGIRFLRQCGYDRPSRNGPVLQAPCPVVTSYRRPAERVLFHALRDGNPFFGMMEALWMIAGHNDVKFPSRFVKTFSNYSDDGQSFHGAYGHRWRHHFGKDQLSIAVRRLKEDPTDRRVVITMWDPRSDLDVQSRDLPCNNILYPLINPSDGALDLTICCRSNDLVFGTYGTNPIHFSMLQEYLAASIGVPVGRLHQLSNNYHAYRTTFDPLLLLGDKVHSGYTPAPNPYADGEVEPFPLMSVDQKTWDEDLGVFMNDGPITGFRDPFFRRVATPLWHAHAAWAQKAKPFHDRGMAALEILEQCLATDWRRAAVEWIQRRMIKGIEAAKAAEAGAANAA